MYGKTHTPEVIKKLRLANTGRSRDFYPTSTKVICIETKTIYLSIREAELKLNINRNCIAECCKGKRCTAGRFHWGYYDEWVSNGDDFYLNKKKGSAKRKKIICIDTGMEYESITMASKSTGINYNCIKDCCTGRQNTAGGYRWMHAN